MGGHTIVHWWKEKGKQRQNVIQPDGELNRQLDTHPPSDSDYGRLNESLERCWKKIAQMRKSLFFFWEIFCVSPVCVVFRWDQRAKSTSWAVRRVALPVCLDTIPSKCWRSKLVCPVISWLPDVSISSARQQQQFQHYQRSWQSLIAQSKVKQYETKLVFLLLLFFGGSSREFPSFVFIWSCEVERDSSNEKESSKVQNSITASAFITPSSIFSFHVVNGLRDQRMRVSEKKKKKKSLFIWTFDCYTPKSIHSTGSVCVCVLSILLCVTVYG